MVMLIFILFCLVEVYVYLVWYEWKYVRFIIVKFWYIFCIVYLVDFYYYDILLVL